MENWIYLSTYSNKWFYRLNIHESFVFIKSLNNNIYFRRIEKGLLFSFKILTKNKIMSFFKKSYKFSRINITVISLKFTGAFNKFYIYISSSIIKVLKNFVVSFFKSFVKDVRIIKFSRIYFDWLS